ncbi:methyltransferase [Streptomyces sp. NBC_01618]|uniref:methyltransferase n=1 Tax=Streptomyces sp. NBC_01618 TaxID=2975900 RepID=UPI003867BD56|nr:acetylserotonin O-methyltransferase [Streptomyces sp. NBC_01618]
MTTHASTTDVSSPESLIRLGTAFCDAKILLSALELDVFSTLAEKPMTEGELSAAVGLHPRGARDFITALVTLGLLELDGGRYRNSPSTGRFLDRGKPSYAGGFLERANSMLYPAWTRLTDALRTGEAQVSSKDGDIVGQMADDPQHLRQFLAMMDSLNSQVGPKLAAAFDWAPHSTFVDVGGARGNLSALIMKDQPHLTATVFDLPHVSPAFDEHMKSLGTEGRISFTGGDFFTDPMPRGEILIMGHVLHNWSTEQRRGLIAKAYEAVQPGGALLVYDRMVAEQPTDLVNLLISLDMLLVTHGGSEYSAEDCQGWMTEAGFTRTEAKVLSNTDSLVIGYKGR